MSTTANSTLFEQALKAYLAEIKKNLAHSPTEHTHRPALKSFVESFGSGILATNDPKRIDCGAPDFNVTRNSVPLGYIETKDIGKKLDDIEKGKGRDGEQFKRFVEAPLTNLILTDYLEFRWYVNGKKRLTARVATLDAKSKLVAKPDGNSELEALIGAFLTEQSFTVGTAKELAKRLSGMARMVRKLILKSFENEKEDGWLHGWLESFRDALIPDLDSKKFADMFAQTLCYGLFAARVHTLKPEEFTREKAAFNLPKTNPFLRKLFAEFAGVSMPDEFAWAVDDIVELLKHTDMSKVLKDFGSGKGKEDPVVHFYETFLSAYDPKIREIRGVYYTPEPVVRYIVRSVDSLLRSQFDKPNGLADKKTLVLDPAVGTATFLFFTIQQVYSQFKTQKGAWTGYVADHLLNRLFGFELLMAPYAIAHLKLGTELRTTGYKFTSDQRLGVYLTNTLEEAVKKAEKLFKFVSDEANEASAIKRDLPILVVLGNPPYSGHSANRSHIKREVQPGDYYAVLKGGPQRSQMYVVMRTAKKKKTIKEKTFIGQLMDDYYFVDDLPLAARGASLDSGTEKIV